MAALTDILHQLDHAAGGITITGLDGSAPAYLLSRLVARHRDYCVLIITPDDDSAAALAGDLGCFGIPEDYHPLLFPPRALPYAGLPTSPEIEVQRLAVLQALVHEAPVVIASVAACLQQLPPRTLVKQYSRTLLPGLPMDRDHFALWLQEAGYSSVPLVEDAGTVAVRGALVDCWPAGARRPVRIECDGDLVGTIRSFDPDTQRSRDKMPAVRIGPADELLFTEHTRRFALQELKRRADDADLPVPQRRPLQDAIEHDLRPPILEGLLPLFYEQPAGLADYLPPSTLVIRLRPDELHLAADAYAMQVRAAHAQADACVQLFAPTELTGSWAQLRTALMPFPQMHLGVDRTASDQGATAATQHTWPTESVSGLRDRLRAARPDEDPLTPLAEHLRQLQAQRMHVTIVCHTSLAAERTLDLFRWHGLALRAADQTAATPHAISVAVGELSAGFVALQDGLAYVTEEELFGRKIRKRPTRRTRPAESFVSFHDLAPGDGVVHEMHGIGRYAGMVQMALPQTRAASGPEIINDFVQLEYLGGDKLYLPVYRLHLLQRYIGPDGAVPALDRLGGSRWSRSKARALHTIRTMAHELLAIYAARRTQAGVSFSGRDHALEEFEASFPYDETPDQWQAIEETLADMQRDQPMDRLVCGDVGYGKTEVAMRAAFRAAMDGHQVAVLCPTTLLAFQHAETFRARFALTGLRIELLSRFRSEAELATVVADLQAGKVDILIGTHRLLSKDIRIPRLGLLIIDEEQRFGVSHKERLRKLRATVDTLALSATPIPRTLHMALAGLRDISIIQTPPADRRAIRTHILPFDDRTIQQAIRYELARGGQVFFLHNRVQTIKAMRDHLTRLIPEARIAMAHGQMEEGELETTMRTFLTREANVLLCTTIIEAGLDIPSANTLIVNRADTFGLAQLYQIRGRVGRSNVQATAYLLTPAPGKETTDTAAITVQAQRRLSTLARFTELGSGFSVAMHDLEMRGAGNLLGAQQSGHIAEIGYELFTRLLERTIRGLRQEDGPETIDTEITVPIPALLPEAYIAEANLRLVWYKRLANCETLADITNAESELQDRFGPLPTEAQHLLQIIALRQEAMRLGIETMQYQNAIWRLKFHPQTPIDAQQLLALVAARSARFQLKPDGVLLVRAEANEPRAVFQTGRELLAALAALH